MGRLNYGNDMLDAKVNKNKNFISKLSHTFFNVNFKNYIKNLGNFIRCDLRRKGLKKLASMYYGQFHS